MKFVDISGFGHSGKSVLTDLLKEFEGFQVPHYNFEFNLIRIQGGLIDLKHALVDNWSPIRSDAALRRFKRLIKRIGPKASLLKPLTIAYSNGMNYDDYFNAQFTPLSLEYIQNLIASSFKGEWPYQMLENSPMSQLNQRLLARLRLKKKFTSEVLLTSVSKQEFLEKTQQYLIKLFGSIAQPHKRVMVTHNSLEPFNPHDGLLLLPNSKLIVVQRDPRDIYASVAKLGGFIPGYESKRNWQIKRAMLGLDDVNIFCNRQLIYYNQVKRTNDSRVLKLRFEDLIKSYDATIHNIYNFLGESDIVHRHKLKFFNPENSIKNIGLYKKLKSDKNLDVIEKRMAEFLYND